MASSTTLAQQDETMPLVPRDSCIMPTRKLLSTCGLVGRMYAHVSWINMGEDLVVDDVGNEAGDVGADRLADVEHKDGVDGDE